MRTSRRIRGSMECSLQVTIVLSGYVRLALAIAHTADDAPGALVSVGKGERPAKRLIDTLAYDLGEGDVLLGSHPSNLPGLIVGQLNLSPYHGTQV